MSEIRCRLGFTDGLKFGLGFIVALLVFTLIVVMAAALVGLVGTMSLARLFKTGYTVLAGVSRFFPLGL